MSARRLTGNAQSGAAGDEGLGAYRACAALRSQIGRLRRNAVDGADGLTILAASTQRTPGP
jgi:hypothetical protein